MLPAAGRSGARDTGQIGRERGECSSARTGQGRAVARGGRMVEGQARADSSGQKGRHLAAPCAEDGTSRGPRLGTAFPAGPSWT